MSWWIYHETSPFEIRFVVDDYWNSLDEIPWLFLLKNLRVSLKTSQETCVLFCLKFPSTVLSDHKWIFILICFKGNIDGLSRYDDIQAEIGLSLRWTLKDPFQIEFDQIVNVRFKRWLDDISHLTRWHINWSRCRVDLKLFGKGPKQRRGYWIADEVNNWKKDGLYDSECHI